ncbi:MAG: hypothetical protein ACXAC5_04950 [Promethearchaeota archaeon]|jgi:hypothetical protein
MSNRVEEILTSITQNFDSLHDSVQELIDVFEEKQPLEDCERYSNELRVMYKSLRDLGEISDDIDRLCLEEK